MIFQLFSSLELCVTIENLVNKKLRKTPKNQVMLDVTWPKMHIVNVQLYLEALAFLILSGHVLFTTNIRSVSYCAISQRLRHNSFYSGF